jgi:hypothetical protein
VKSPWGLGLCRGRAGTGKGRDLFNGRGSAGDEGIRKGGEAEAVSPTFAPGKLDIQVVISVVGEDSKTIPKAASNGLPRVW